MIVEPERAWQSWGVPKNSRKGSSESTRIMVAAWIGSVSFLIWVYLLAGRGRFWQVSNSASESKLLLMPAPRVAVVMPARNEARVVRQAILSLLQQDYAGQVQIYVVDDHSSDETANVARRAAAHKAEQITISLAMPLPAGWTGKLWALSQGVEQATSSLLTIICSQMRTSSIPAIASPLWLRAHRGINSISRQ